MSATLDLTGSSFLEYIFVRGDVLQVATNFVAVIA